MKFPKRNHSSPLHSLCYIFGRERPLHLLSFIIIFTTMQWYFLRRGNTGSLILHLFYLELESGYAHCCHSETQDERDLISSCGMNIANSKMGGDESGTSSKILCSHFIKCKSAVQTWLVGRDSSILLWPEFQVQQKKQAYYLGCKEEIWLGKNVTRCLAESTG